MIHCHRIRVISSCMGHGEVPPFLVCKPLHIRNRSEALGSNLVKKSKSSPPQVAEDFNQNISLLLLSALYFWFDKPTCRLLVPVRWSERYHKAAQSTLVPDYKTTKCKKWQFESIQVNTKKMMSLCYWNTPSHKDGQEPSRKYLMHYNPIGLSTKNVL